MKRNRHTGGRHALKLVRELYKDQRYEYYPVGRFVVMARGVCGGRPTFKGTRIEVQTVLNWLRTGRTIQDIIQSYPSLSRAAVQEAIRLAGQALASQYTLQAA
jgi:uncharacterized protein (DUF433 family)